MNWNDLKPIVEQEIAKANITDKKFITLLMRFRRRINTCKNNLCKQSWQSVIESSACTQAYFIIEDMQDNYNKLWEDYCNANNICINTNVGDWLC